MTFGARGRYRTAEREAATTTGLRRRALVDARDALDQALWSLDTQARGRRELRERNERAREALLAATRALSHARVHDPRIKTLAPPVLYSGLRDPRAEAGRLHDFAHRLLWWNHRHLPPRRKALPLGPEDEAQLARIQRSLDGYRRLEGISRHRWLLAFGLASALAPVFGAAAGIAALTFGGLEIAGMLRANASDPESL